LFCFGEPKDDDNLYAELFSRGQGQLPI
jgi:hypothetical protein